MPTDALTLRDLSKSKPHTFTFPLVFVTVPPSILKNVVLPAPLGPNKPNTSPCSTVKFNSFSALFRFLVLVSCKFL